MFVRLVRFTLSDKGLSMTQLMADDIVATIKAQPGCESAVFYCDEEDGVSGMCVLWDSQEHADMAAGIVAPKLDGHLRGNMKEGGERRLFPVIAS